MKKVLFYMLLSIAVFHGVNTSAASASAAAAAAAVSAGTKEDAQSKKSGAAAASASAAAGAASAHAGVTAKKTQRSINFTIWTFRGVNSYTGNEYLKVVADESDNMSFVVNSIKQKFPPYGEGQTVKLFAEECLHLDDKDLESKLKMNNTTTVRDLLGELVLHRLGPESYLIRAYHLPVCPQGK